MKRRSFLASIAGIFAAPFVAQKATEKTFDETLAEMLKTAGIDSTLPIPMTATEFVNHYRSKPAQAQKIRRAVWQEWKNSGGMIEHATDPGKIHDSFVVKVDWV